MDLQAAERTWLSNGHPGRRYLEIEETASLRFEGMGGLARRCGLPPQMYGMRAPDYDCAKAGREECERHYQISIKFIYLSILSDYRAYVYISAISVTGIYYMAVDRNYIIDGGIMMDMRRYCYLSFLLVGMAVFGLWTGGIEVYAKQEEVSDELVTESNHVFPDNFRNVLFIGDSRTVGLYEYGELGEADVFAKCGIGVFDLWNIEVCCGGNEKKTLGQALTQKQYETIHLMLGINELGYPTEEILKKYRETVEQIQNMQPQARIILGSNLHVTSNKSEGSTVYNNPKIDGLNSEIQQIGQELNCYYIDSNERFDDMQGNLPNECSSDGLHMSGKYYAEWVQWLREKTL